ncbi:MAG: Gmad2 immunoglobulin-like domain-containing protein [Dehalococcoidia bacterium]
MKMLLLLLTMTAVAAFAACGDDDDDTDVTQTPAGSVTGAPTASESPSATDEVTATPGPTVTNVCPENPDSATPDELIVNSPSAGLQVSSPLVVQGLATAFEAVFHITIVDAEGNEITDQPGMTEEGQVLAPYEEPVAFEVTEATDACLEVYMLSAMDGSVINMVQVPIVLLP